MNTARTFVEKRVETAIYITGLVLCGAIGAIIFSQLISGAAMPRPETAAIVGAVVGIIFGNIPIAIMARRHAADVLRTCQKYFRMLGKS